MRFKNEKMKVCSKIVVIIFIFKKEVSLHLDGNQLGNKRHLIG
ncbi:hypothetical protein RV00_GL000206 [Enterococcus devriesei]|uniref:Uncharacterized protein n=1 Tax=Enterococcus devriesei TaxID=319970 RepID=A0A1L8SYU8_9ENTE|nr:hypothetical protein RV00_GL000206 [Enterococcus devriesei]